MPTFMEFAERQAFVRSLTSPFLFRNLVRPAVYLRVERQTDHLRGTEEFHGVTEVVHKLALAKLNEYEPELRQVAPRFDFPELQTTFGSLELRGPFGTAAGFDKNAEAALPISHVMDFQEPGTITVNVRPGNKGERMGVDEANDTPYNAQGFPFKGLENFLQNMDAFHNDGGKGKFFMNFCGMPSQEKELTLEQQLAVADAEYLQLLKELKPYGNAFVYNCFSPNTQALKKLRSPDVFRENARIARRILGDDVPLLAKIGPYPAPHELGVSQEEWQRMIAGIRNGTHEYGTVKGDETFALVQAWIEGGGNGTVAINTQMTPKDQIPFDAMGIKPEHWGYEHGGGKSGKGLAPSRRRILGDMRTAFPGMLMVGVGGIYKAKDAWESLQYADVLEGFSGYGLYGFGAKIKMAEGVLRELSKKGYGTLAEFQREQRNAWSAN
jgi:dihydroorotate dehydrogenase